MRSGFLVAGLLIVCGIAGVLWKLAPTRFAADGAEWALAWRGSDRLTCSGLCVDPEGNLYVSGWFMGRIDFDPGWGVCWRNADHKLNGFILKLDQTGRFQWVTTSDSMAFDDVATNDAHGVFATGDSEHEFCFSGGIGSTIRASRSGGAFLARLNASGELCWVRHLDSDGFVEANSVAVGSSGRVYVTGSFEETVRSNSVEAATEVFSKGLEDVFLAAFDSAGGFRWLIGLGGESSYDHGRGLVVDKSGNILVGGWSRVTEDLQREQAGGPASSARDNAFFVTKVIRNGEIDWERRWGRSGGFDWGPSLAADVSGNIYATGSFHDALRFPDDGPTEADRPASWPLDIYLRKFTPSGEVAWAHTWGGVEEDSGNAVATDLAGNINVTGGTRPETDSDPEAQTGTGSLPGTVGTRSLSMEAFFSKFEPGGALQAVWVEPRVLYGRDLAIDSSGRVYLAGSIPWGFCVLCFSPNTPR